MDKKMSKYITDNIEIYSNQENSDEKISNKGNSDEDMKNKFLF